MPHSLVDSLHKIHKLSLVVVVVIASVEQNVCRESETRDFWNEYNSLVLMLYEQKLMLKSLTCVHLKTIALPSGLSKCVQHVKLRTEI